MGEGVKEPLYRKDRSYDCSGGLLKTYPSETGSQNKKVIPNTLGRTMETRACWRNSRRGKESGGRQLKTLPKLISTPAGGGKKKGGREPEFHEIQR